MTGSGRRGPIAWMAANPIAANLAMIVLLGGGIWSALRIQKEVFPQFQLDTVEITVVYPGAPPSEVESGILLPIEEAVRGVQGIKEIKSTAEEGSAEVVIELVAGADRVTVFQEIDQAITRIRTFPDDIEEPEVRLLAEQREIMEVGVYGDADIWTLRQLAERLRDQLLSDPAISQVEIDNVPAYVTHVEIPQARLREHGLTLGAVAELIARSSEDIPAGAVETYSGEVLLRMNERKQWAEELGTIVILTSESGSTLELADIATITDGFEETGFHGQFNGKPSVELQIYQIGPQSPLEIASSVQTVLAEFETTLPRGVRLRVDSSAAEDYRDRLGLLVENGVLAIFIVLGILALFLELRLAFWVMMGMSISFIGGLLFLPLSDVSVNMISLFGFLVVLGIVVDDAVVVGENVYGHKERGEDPRVAAVRGTREVAQPVTYSVLTTILAFVPLLFIPGSTGKYWWPLPAVVITVLLVSLFESLFILPAHLAHASPRRKRALERWLAERQVAFARGFARIVERFYGPLLARCLARRYVTFSAGVALLIIVSGYAYSAHMGVIMMPEVAADEIEAGISLPEGTTIEQAAEVAQQLTAATRRMFDEHSLYEVAEGIKTNVRGQTFIDVEIVMKPPDEREMTARELIGLWRDEIGDIQGVDQITFEAERGPGGYEQDISVDLSHDDIGVLERATEVFVERVSRLEPARDVNDNFDKGKVQLDLELLPEGRNLGLTSSDVGNQVRDAFFGALAMRQLRGTHEVEVRVKLPKAERKELATFEQLVLRTPNGTEVPLREVVEIERSEAFTTITRRNGRRVVTISMDVEPKRALTGVLEVLRTRELPQLRSEFPGLTSRFEGTQAEMRESTAALWSSFALALGAIYALLALAFRSYAQPIIVMGAIPFGVIGAVLGHMLLDYDLSLVSLMGIVALSGVVVNDSLILVDFANRNRGERPAFQAVHEAGLRRFRPIVLTTLTTFGGLAPIILETSNQANHLIPMAISLGFGIVFATAIVLLVVPSMYLMLEDLKTLGRRAAARSASRLG